MKFQNKIKSFLKFLFIILISVIINLLLAFFIGFKNYYTYFILLLIAFFIWKLLIKSKVLKTKNKKGFIFCLFFTLFIYFSIVLVNDKDLRINISFETYNFFIKQKKKIERVLLDEKNKSNFEDNEEKREIVNKILPKLYSYIKKDDLTIVEGPIFLKNNKFLNVEEAIYKLKNGFEVSVSENNLISRISIYKNQRNYDKLNTFSIKEPVKKGIEYIKDIFPDLKGDFILIESVRRPYEHNILIGVKGPFFYRNLIYLDLHINGDFKRFYILGDISDLKSPLENK